MANELHKALCAALSVIAFGFLMLPAVGTTPEEKMFSRIQVLSDEGKSKKLCVLGEEFVKKYPESRLSGEVFFLMGEHSTSIDRALKYFRAASSRLNGNRSLDARLNACRILHLASRWKDLEEEASKALSHTKDETHKADFMLHLARAYIAEEEYEKTADLCENIIKTSNQPSRIMPALLMLSHAERKMTGYSRGYFSILRDVIEGFNHTESACVALYLLGRAHQERGDYDRAYSAYRDVVTRFPRSPEAAFAAEKISSLQKHNPKIVAFLPDESFLKSLDRIDLPDFRNPEEEKQPKKSFYAIMLGPVEEKADALDIARSIKGEFAPVKIVQSAGRYAVYAGRVRDAKSAATMKIRLAEEMGYNGKIVKVRTEDNKTYIYGE